MKLTFIAIQAVTGGSQKAITAGAIVQTRLGSTLVGGQLTPVTREAHRAAAAVKSLGVTGVVDAYAVDARAALAAYVTHAARRALEHCSDSITCGV